MSEVKIISATKDKTNIKKDESKKKKKRVCAYARVSTDEEEQITSYKSQIEHYSTLIKNNPDWEFVGVYADEGISGTQMKNRTQFLKMLEDCKNNRIDMIIAKSISRFARNTVDTLNTVRVLRNLNIDIYFEKENIHTLDLDSEMFLTLYSAFAQAESESTSQNVKMGMRAKMKRGEACGKMACYGFNWDKVNKELSVNEEEAKVVKKIFDLYLKGFGSSKICEILESENILSATGGKKWHPSVVKLILRNEKYVGDLCGQKYYVANPLNHRSILNRGEKDKFYVKNHHVPIVSREIFDAVQEIYNKRSIKVKDGKEYCEKFSMRYPLSSMIVCGNCGNDYVRRLDHHRNKENKLINYVYWMCSCNKYKKGYCDKNKSIKEEDIEKLFVELFSKFQLQTYNENLIEKISKIIMDNDPSKEIKKMENNEKIINNKISKLLDLKLLNDIDDVLFDSKYKELKIELDNVKKDKKNLLSNNYKQKEQKTQLKKIENELNKFKITSFNIDIFKKLVKKVIVGGYDEDGEFKVNLVKFILNVDGNSFRSLGCYDRANSSKANI